ncbi:MAG: hypothetical protein R6W72_08010 [Desulfurivibrionaceae bacterium]
MVDATGNRNIKAAALDLGSNTFRLLIAGFKGDKPSLLLKRNITVQLGRGLGAGAGLSSDSVKRACAALREFKAEIDRHQPDCLRCCGTEALRRAADADEFLDKATGILGVGVEVIDGAQEASLTYRGVLASLDEKHFSYPILVIDVGGSSTELIYGESLSLPPESVSLAAGAGLFTELAESGALAAPFELMRRGLGDFLAERSLDRGRISLVGTGGTATTMAMLDLGLDHYDQKRVQGHYLTRAAIRRILAELRTLPVAARKFLPGLEEGRGDIILAGIEIYQEILATIEVDGMIVSDFGLLEGIMMSCLEHDSLPR